MKKVDCPRCHGLFLGESRLQQHLNKRMPCAEITLSTKELIAEHHAMIIARKNGTSGADDLSRTCSFCKKVFATPTSMRRHQNNKICTTARITHISNGSTGAPVIQTINNIDNSVNNVNTININVNVPPIRAYDPSHAIFITINHIKAVLMETERGKECVALIKQLEEGDILTAIIAGVCMEFVKLVQSDPHEQNIQLNNKDLSQALLVVENGVKISAPIKAVLSEVILSIHNHLRKTVTTPSQLTLLDPRLHDVIALMPFSMLHKLRTTQASAEMIEEMYPEFKSHLANIVSRIENKISH